MTFRDTHPPEILPVSSRYTDETLRILARALFLLLLADLHPLAADELPIQSFTSTQGLGDNRVRHIFEDSRGFLWFATGGGLTRFDGLNLFNFGGEQGDPTTTTNDILEDPSGNYWVATNGAGLVRFKAGAVPALRSAPGVHRFEVFPVAEQAAANRVNVILRDRHGTLWLGTDGGLFRLQETNGRVSIARAASVPGIAAEILPIWALAEDAGGSVWAGSTYGLIRNLPDGTAIRYSLRTGPGADRVTSLAFDRAGRLWIAHQSGLFVLKPNSIAARAAPSEVLIPSLAAGTTLSNSLPDIPGTLRHYGGPDPANPTVSVVQMLRNGEVWAATPYRGVFRFENLQFHPVLADARFTEVATIFEDRESNVWVGSGRFGALKMLRHGFITHGPADGVTALPATVLADRSGDIEIGMAEWRVGYRKDRRFAVARLAPGLAAGETWRSRDSVLQDHLGEWWIGTRAGLHRYPKAARLDLLAPLRPRIYTRRDGLRDDDVYRIFEDSRGDLWIANFTPTTHAITRWDRATGAFVHYGASEGLPTFNAVATITEDRQGAVWIGLRDGGLARFKDGRFRYFGPSNGAGPGTVRASYADRSGRLWCAFAQSGLYRFDDLTGDRLTPVIYDRRHGLSSDVFTAIGEDAQGRIYAGAQHGVDRIDLSANRIEHFTESDGLAGGGVQKIVRDASNTLWFVTLEGLSSYTPDAGTPPRHPRTLISGLRIGGAEYMLSAVGHTRLSLPDLPAANSSLEFEYLVLGAAPGEAALVNYMLEGADQEWSAPTSLRTVNYAHLAPGEYRFRVRASAQDGAPSGVTFRILPPFWKTWWFLSLVVALAGCSLFAFDHYRVGHLRALGAALAVSEENERRFRTLAETASDPILTLDGDGVIRFVNAAAESTFGYPATETIGKSITMLMPAAFRERHVEGMRRYLETGERRTSWRAVELTGMHRDGREIPLEVSFGEFTREGERFFTGVMRDITERKQAQQRLEQAREERLAELERVRKRIAADLHDEIGSSLTQISILSEVALRSIDGPPELTRPLNSIAASSRELVDGMSDIVWAINPAKDHLSDLASRMRRVAVDTFPGGACTLRLELPSNAIGVKLGANIRRELFLIFKEALNNMAKHSGCTEASVRVVMEGSLLMLELRDNGRGFDPGLAYEGHGLASLRSRAAALGGEIEIHSAPGRGTTIRLRAPIPA